MRSYRLPYKVIACKACGKNIVRTGSYQLYCRSCSEERHAERNRLYCAAHRPTPEKNAIYRSRQKSRVMQRGIEISRKNTSSISDTFQNIEMEWSVNVAIPFSRAASKNFVYYRGGHHIALREEVRSYRQLIGVTLKSAMRDIPLVQNKLWISLFVQKLANKGDAINVVDTICDAIVDAIGLDDRWFCIKKLDWEIVKEKPRIFLGLSQERGAKNVQACSSCGRLLTFDHFNKQKTNKAGIARNCRECRKARFPERSESLSIAELNGKTA